jgi:hypothetical protein
VKSDEKGDQRANFSSSIFGYNLVARPRETDSRRAAGVMRQGKAGLRTPTLTKDPRAAEKLIEGPGSRGSP